ncbi:hypothetical protein Shyd_71900 [Streptomyces hydrogenans]|uniref:Uncharacterized protein n=1 Tax=Streptomyces hydrogenans TaxID=1873719 RepID=A0ABQ3PD46_9ACTN|nr:hypothetical protein GCM10018784_35770 [Streptomyces hydrogenans]GHI20307.1 hypothetical protein Shyd_16780 [Streptomyces hydrogenans]GHI22904.1 hypothetical protein Shyd_42750 [Streptomyces hydrogenans]GHI24359.1 hypothetical protein Shyd_57300 [Streptomyces hydrogenans]GHI25743.1 hypothetical protein Shyd_71140 [Streptomyces hydrogenans]
MEGSTEGACPAGSKGCSGSVLATGCSWRWGGPVPPFTFYRCGFRARCDGGFKEPLRRDRIVISPGEESSPPSAAGLCPQARSPSIGFEAAAISGAARM